MESNILCIEHIFHISGFNKISICKVSNLYEQLKDKSIKECLKIMKIPFLEKEETITFPSIVEIDGNMLVLEGMNEGYYELWSPTTRTKIKYKEDETKLKDIIHIYNIKDKHLKMLNYNYYKKNKYEYFWKNKAQIVTTFFLTLIESILITIIAFLFFMIFDYYYYFKDLPGIKETLCFITLFCLLCGLVFTLKQRILNTTLVLKNERNLLSSINISNIVVKVMLLNIVVYYFNSNISFYLLMNIVCIILFNIILYTFLTIEQYDTQKSKISLGTKILLGLYIVLGAYLLIISVVNMSLGVSKALMLLILYFCIVRELNLMQAHFLKLKQEVWSYNEFVLKNLLQEEIDVVNLDTYDFNVYISRSESEYYMIEQGKTSMFIGSSNSGKTLLSKYLSGEEHGEEYKIYFGENNIHEYGKDNLKKIVGRINNNMRIEELEEDIKKINKFSTKSDIKYVLNNLQMATVIDNNEEININLVNYLSDTDTILITLAVMILKNYYIIIVDNVFSRIDSETIVEIIEFCNSLDIIIILLEQKSLNLNIQVNEFHL